MDRREVLIPLVLLGLGVVIFVVDSALAAGAEGGAVALIGIGVGLAISVALGVVALLIAARVLQTSFGDLHTAVLKLAAIFVFPGAIASLIPSVPIAWVVSLILYLGLLAWLFELDGWEILVCAFIIWIVGFVAALLTGLMLAA